MLPYSPLHHLLAHDVAGPLVLTSGNVSDEPIAFTNADALERLQRIADYVLVHDRPIHTRTDDSVVRNVRVGGRRRPQLLRRSRGYVPDELELPVPAQRPLVACGAELKNTFCVAKSERAWVGHHIGDLENWETLRSFTQGIDHFEHLFAVEPEVVVHDAHPEYLSTKYALDRAGFDALAVQHHHAHLAACLAEHGLEGPALGAIFDGTGYGSDGTIWGGELLFGDLTTFRREGSLWPVPMPGGAAAIREPWRMACAWLDADPAIPAALAGEVTPVAWRGVCELVRNGVASPVTTSAGRLFDAVAALCGVRSRVNYEGQAAIELEAACDPAERGSYPLPLLQRGRLVLDPRPTIAAVARDVNAGAPAAAVASRFHNTIARATAGACTVLARRRRVQTIVLSGGVFQNRRLLEATAALLAGAGLDVLTPERLPPNDGGISFGQAAVAAARMNRGLL
jgi:hydrogenase maturation protein HypF